MTPDGISTEEWDHVYEICIDLVNASAIDDQVLVESYRERLFEFLDQLEIKYGRIASVLATRADFTPCPITAIPLLEEALLVSTDDISTRLTLQSLVKLMIEEKYEREFISKRLQELEKLTTDSSDLEVLNELQSLFNDLFSH